MKDTKFRAWDDKIVKYTLEEEIKPGHYLQHYISVYPNNHKQAGYIMRKVKRHPYCNNRGYVPEHRLIMEVEMGRVLKPRQELIHHVNKDRSDNRIQNLKLSNPKDHASGHVGERNDNGRFAPHSKEFDDIKFRLYDKDRNITQIFSLTELIGKTFRRGKFVFHGRHTGLKDATGREIYEGDVVKDAVTDKIVIKWNTDAARFTAQVENICWGITKGECSRFEVIGNVHQPELLKA